MDLNGKRAIVTGGSQGIGLAVARGLATEGVDVVLAARSAEPLEAAAAALVADTGRRVIAVPTDTGDDDQVRELVRRTVAELGGVDILVNAAATPWSAGLRPAWPTPATRPCAGRSRSRFSAICALLVLWRRTWSRCR